MHQRHRHLTKLNLINLCVRVCECFSHPPTAGGWSQCVLSALCVNKQHSLHLCPAERQAGSQAVVSRFFSDKWMNEAAGRSEWRQRQRKHSLITSLWISLSPRTASHQRGTDNQLWHLRQSDRAVCVLSDTSKRQLHYLIAPYLQPLDLVWIKQRELGAEAWAGVKTGNHARVTSSSLLIQM